MTDSQTGKPPITAVILSYNETLHLARCIERLWPVVERIIVIDSFSTDDTVDIARTLGAEVLQNKFVNHAAQFQWGVDNANITSAWTMRLDCDEYLEPDLAAEIAQAVVAAPPSVTAFSFRRKVFFKGKFIRWGGYHKTVLTRLWRTGYGEIEMRWMDEHIVVREGDTVRLRGGDFVDDNLNDLRWWTDKHNVYSTRQMIELINREHPLFVSDTRMESDANSSARFKRFLRNRVYGGVPLYVRAVLYFLQRYFLRLGFLDGRRGFVWHFLQGFWYYMLVDAKVDEARSFIRDHGLEAFKSHLASRHGITDLAPGGAAAR
jgi:glycosyltransferase involved in cell wall biosynthesis